jgi:hypothetical protein|tara:strand:+ start:606 stop:1538 length:933 start_codon:yes stop_codon:yes gene_type:complete
MRKVALISTFCDNKEKLNLLIENIRKIKNLEIIDVIIYTPIQLPHEIYEICDAVIFSKENPVLNWPNKCMEAWIYKHLDNKILKLYSTVPDYGYAGLNQVKRMADLALSMGYDQFFPTIYDIEINEEIENILISNKTNNFYPSRRGNTLWEVGLHLISLNRECMGKFNKLINKDNYLNHDSKGDAFTFVKDCIIKENLGTIESTPEIIDKIAMVYDPWNCSPTNKFKCFIQKNIEAKENIKILLYGYKDKKLFQIYIDDMSLPITYFESEWGEVNLPSPTVKKLEIESDGVRIDFTNEFIKIGRNKIEKL